MVFSSDSGKFPPKEFNLRIMKPLLKPGRLSFGDTVGIIAPASAPSDPKAVDRAAAALERFGFKPKLEKMSGRGLVFSPARTVNARRM